MIALKLSMGSRRILKLTRLASILEN